MTTRTDASDKTAPRRAPRQRRTATAPARPKGYEKARLAFEARAQDWMIGRPNRLVNLPEDLRRIVTLGVPCQTCGNLIDRFDGSHQVTWSRQPGEHWAAGIIAVCVSGD